MAVFGEARFGQGSGDIMLDNLRCRGSEDDIFDCPSNGLDINDCSHAEDAGVECRTKSHSTPSTSQFTPSAPPPEGKHFGLNIFYLINHFYISILS